MNPTQTVLAALAAVDKKAKPAGRSKWQCQCPAHDVRWLSALSPTKQGRLVKCGLLDGRFVAVGKPLVEHIEDWHAVMLARGNTAKHAARYRTDARRIIASTKAVYLADLSASRVQRALEAIGQERGVGLQSLNHALRAIKTFSRWLVSDRRATEDALAHLKAFNVKTDRRHDRRALSGDEITWLLSTTQAGPDREALSGDARAMLYRVAMGTGFRRCELASLTPEAFDLDGTPPTATVQAGYSKRRRTDVQPLPADLAAMLKPWLEGWPADVPLWGSLPHTARMLKEDLAAARAAWIATAQGDAEETKRRTESDFLCYCDSRGLYADFHATRHSYITMLVNSGAPVKAAQELARHSTPTLTLGRYSHIGLSDTARALEALPSFAPPTPAEPQAAQAKRTGTDDAPAVVDAVAKTDAVHLGAPLALSCAGGRIPATSGGAQNASAQSEQTRMDIGFSKENGESGIRTRGTGLSPYIGLANRRLQPLGHLSRMSRLHSIHTPPAGQ